MRRSFSILFILLCAWPELSPCAPVGEDFRNPFEGPFVIEAGSGSLPHTGYRMSRNPSRQMAADRQGRLHITYWQGGSVVSPEEPSQIFYQSWTASDGFGPQVVVDNSVSDEGGQPIGGRLPNLTLTRDGEVWIVWHDYRHCAGSPGNWMNNVEIYADRMPLGGSFSSTDIRLTKTQADFLGDNGFAPRLVERHSGALGVCWYDMHFDNVAELCYRESDANRAFDVEQSIDSMRLTNVANRGGDPLSAYVMPDMVVDDRDEVHLVWTNSNFSFTGDLFYGRITSGAVLQEETRLREGGGHYWYPPRIFTSPARDRIWVAWTGPPFGESKIHLMSRSSGGGPWSDEIVLPLSGSQESVCADVGPDGRIHLVYVSDGIGYARYDPVSGVIEESGLVAGPETIDASGYPFPAIHVGPRGEVYILWSEKSEGVAVYDGDLYLLVRPAPPAPRPAGAFWVSY